MSQRSRTRTSSNLLRIWYNSIWHNRNGHDNAWHNKIWYDRNRHNKTWHDNNWNAGVWHNGTMLSIISGYRQGLTEAD